MIIGLVGKPSCGKSTFFKASTLMDVDIANYPFTTIKPNSGVGYVRVECACKHFGVICNPKHGFCKNNIRYVPVEIIDVAGLVPDAHLGKGRGNQFLNDLNQADVLIHVVDISGSLNDQGEPIETGSYDPSKDIRFLEIEIDYWYLGILKKGWDKFSRQVQQEHGNLKKAITKQMSSMRVTEPMVEEVLRNLGLLEKRITEFTDDELLKIATEFRKRTKPIIIAANKIDVGGGKENYERIKKEFPELMIIPCSAESELALKEAEKHGLIDYAPGEKRFVAKEGLNDNQKHALDFIQKNILNVYGSTGIQDVLDDAIFDKLKYIAIFPGGMGKLQDQDGNVLPDCFLLPPGSTALDFAFKIHSDLGEGFIKAMDVKKKLPVGKEHKLANGDVIEIMSKK